MTQFTWYLEPADHVTNSAIDQKCQGIGFAFDRPTENGELPLWQCEFEVCKYMLLHKKEKGFDFNVFVQENKEVIRSMESIFAEQRKRKPRKIAKIKAPAQPTIFRTERIFPERKKSINFIGSGLDCHMYP